MVYSESGEKGRNAVPLPTIPTLASSLLNWLPMVSTKKTRPENMLKKIKVVMGFPQPHDQNSGH